MRAVIDTPGGYVIGSLIEDWNLFSLPDPRERAKLIVDTQPGSKGAVWRMGRVSLPVRRHDARVREYTASVGLTAAQVFALSHAIMPLVDQIIGGATELWDGDALFTVLNPAARKAEAKLVRLLGKAEGTREAFSPADMYPNGLASTALDADSTEAEVEAEAAAMRQWAGESKVVLIGDIEAHLWELIESLEEVDEEEDSEPDWGALEG